MSVLTFLVPGETLVLALAPTVFFFVLWLLIYIVMSAERLIVCQRGILLGSFAPLLQPYAIGYEQMVVGSVVPISGGIRRYHKQTGIAPFTPSIRTAWWSQRGVAIAGPTPTEARARLKHGVVADQSRRHGSPWLIGTRAPAEAATGVMARAAGAAGFTELANATAMAPPRTLSGQAADNPTQLPKLNVSSHS